MSEINIGTPVYSSDDSNLGDVDQLIIDVANRVVVSLIIDKKVMSNGRIIDVNQVAQASTKGVVLNITKEEANHAPEYVTRELVQFRDVNTYGTFGTAMPLGGGSTDWMVAGGGAGGLPSTGTQSLYPMPLSGEIVTENVSNVPAEYVFVDENTDIIDSNFDKIGRLDIVEFTEGTKIGSFVMIAGHIFRKNYRIPVDWVAGTSKDHVRLTKTKDEVESSAEVVP